MFGFEFEEGGVAELWARNHFLQAGIVFKGLVPFIDLLNSLAVNVDIFVHPSLEEACCMAVIEAMAMGLPVIGGRSSGAVPWLLSEGNAGLLVDVTSASSIASGMHKLADDITLRNSLATVGRELACSRYRIGAAVDRYEDILSRAATESPK
jgi:glycosyltransferase involved in cell wall biosynthesis